MIVMNQEAIISNFEEIQPSIIPTHIMGFSFSIISWIQENSISYVLQALDAGLGEGTSQALTVTTLGIKQRNIRATAIGLLSGMIIGGANYVRLMEPELNGVITVEESIGI